MIFPPRSRRDSSRSNQPHKRPLRLESLEDRINPVMIDLFATVPPQSVTVTGQGTNTSSLGGLAGVLGGSREITIINNGPNIAQNITTVEINQSSSDAYDQGQTRPGSTVITRWDGNANGVLDPTGLGGIDLTAAGAQNALRLNILVDDLPFPLKFRVYTNATNYSDLTLNLPGGIYTGSSQILLFNTFTTGTGAAGPATLTNIGAIEMIVDGTTQALDLQLDLVDAIGQVDLSVAKTVNNATPYVGEVVTYSVTVTNRNATSIAKAIDVKLKDLLPAGLVFVGATPPGTTTYNPISGIWDLTTLPLNPGASATLQIQAQAVSTGNISNYVEVVSVGNANTIQIDTDSTPNNNSTNEDDDDTRQITVNPLDFGDAPDTYGTLLVSNGARHAPVGPTLGGARDAEANGAPGAAANGDGADEDGVTIGAIARNASLVIPVVASGASRLNAWFDLNANGTFEPGEQLLVNYVLAAGTNLVPLTIPASATLGATYARFRLTSGVVATPSPVGFAPDGEVEDYAITIVEPTDLELTKTVDNATPDLGGQVVYTLTLNNVSGVQATGVTVLDVLPPGLSFVSASPSGVYNSATGIWTVGTVNASSSVTLSITANVTASGTITNYAQVRTVLPGDLDSTPNDNSTTQDDDDQTPITVAPVDFGDAPNSFGTLLASNGARHVATGVTLGVTRDSENNGQPTANADGDGADEDGVSGIGNLLFNANNTVTLTSVGSGFVNAWIDYNQNGTFDAGELVLNDVAVNGSQNVTITVPPTALLGFTYARFRITSTPQGAGASPVGLLPDGEVEDYRVQITRRADLSLTKTVNNTTPNLGDVVTYTITVSNAGPNSATGLTVVDLLPAGVSYIDDDSDSTSTTYSPGTGVWNIGTLNAGSSISLQITASVTASGAIANYAQVQTVNEFDPNSSPGNNSTTEDDDDTSVITVPPQDFGDAPDTYGTLLASNGARHIATGVTLGATRDSENNGQPTPGADGDGADEDGVSGIATIISDTGNTVTLTSVGSGFVNAWIDYNQNGTFDAGELVLNDVAVNGSQNVTITVPPTALLGFTYARFRITSTPQGAGASPVGLLPDGEVEDYRVQIIRQANVSLTKTVSNATPNLNDVILYTITVSNAGPNSATGLTVVDVLPAGVVYAGDNSSSSGTTYTAGSGLWNIGTLNSGSSISLQITVRVVASGTISNYAQVQTVNEFDPNSSPGNNSTTEDDDETRIITVPPQDFGDAPDSYGTVLVNNGARHIATGVTLGATRDSENNGQPSANATGDGADEDGVSFGALIIGRTNTVNLTSSSAGFVNAWIDFNQNGTFEAGEQILTNFAINGAASPSILIAGTALAGNTYARFRITSTTVATPSPVGLLPDGEVEDYLINLQEQFDYGDAPDTFGTTRGVDGARHVVIAGAPILGDGVDIDPNGQPSAGADGDDTNISDDENGITFGSLLPSTSGTVTVFAPTGGRLNAWIDFNANGVFDAAEQITLPAGTVLNVGFTTINFPVPLFAVPGQTYARFRISTSGNLGPTGFASDGEVEDYRVTIPDVVGSLGDRIWFDLDGNGAQDGGEPGLANIDVTARWAGPNNIFNDGDDLVYNDTTDALGNYQFTGIFPGLYRVTVDTADLPGNMTQTFDVDGILNNQADITLGVQENRTDVDFGYTGTLSLGDRVWFDPEFLGVQNIGEPGFSGVTVNLRWAGQNNILNDADDVTYTTTTVSNGAYSFPRLPAGRYVVSVNAATLPTGATVPTSDLDGIGTPHTVTINNLTTSRTDVDFGYRGDSGLGGVVYIDRNNNGVFEPGLGETGIPNVFLTLTGIDALGVITPRVTVTNGSGAYSFTGMLPGTYSVTETQPAAFADGKDTVGTVNGTPSGTVGNDVLSGIVIPAAQAGINYNFGERVPGRITGTVFVDQNRNGIQDPEDPGLGAVTLTLIDPEGNVFATTTTSISDGTYSFESVPEGAYTLVQTQPAAYGSSTSNTLTLVVVGNETTGGKDFGETLGQLAGVVYVDLNNNGLRDANEPGIQNAALTLTGTDLTGQPVNRTVSTTEDGSFVFANLPAGFYTLNETQPPGFTDGLDGAGTAGGTVGNDVISSITLQPGQQTTGYRFGERGTVLSGRVFIDLNRNGVFDPGEPPIPNVPIALRPSGGGISTLAFSGPDGLYLFSGLTPGSYTLEQNQPSGYGTSTPNTLIVTVPAGGLTGQDFGETVALLSGTVHWARVTNNGLVQPGEPGITGVVVRLTGIDAKGATIDRTTTTDGSGVYRFLNLLGGRYTITETQPIGFRDGVDAVGNLGGTLGNDVISNINLPSGGYGTGYNFGELIAPGATFLSGVVFVDQNNDGSRGFFEPGIGGVNLTLRNSLNEVVRTAVTQPDGTYSFLVLPPGTYTITETQPTGYNSTTPNVLTVTVPASGLINQNFGETQSSLSGSVYFDANNNGLRDPNEVGIAGVVVNLEGSISRNITTGADGEFLFDQLVGGSYTLTEVQPADYLDGQDRNGTAGGTVGNDVISAINLAVGQKATGYLFGEVLSGLSGRVYLDVNYNGVLDPGEPGIPGVQLEVNGVSSTGGSVSQITVTAADGTYRFILPASDAEGYTLTETQPAFFDGADLLGSLGGTLSNDQVTGIVVPPGVIGTGYLFGEESEVISGTVYLDVNRNQTRDPNEPGIGGVQVEFRDPSGTIIATTTTAPDGSYFFPFTELPSGDYTVVETQPNGYGSSTPNTVVVPIIEGGVSDVDFGETAGSLSGVVFSDHNINGTRQANEVPIGGVRLILTGTDANGVQVRREVVTDANGVYTFANLLSGTYTITEIQPIGFYDGLPHAAGTLGAATITDLVFTGINVPEGVNGTGYNFGEVPPADPFGFVYIDANNNGVKDVGEAGIPNVLIQISGTAFAGTPLARPLTALLVPGGLTRLTDATGFYHYSIMPPGVYTIRETQPAGFIDGRESLTDPANRTVLSPPVVIGNDVFSNIELFGEDPRNPGTGLPDIRGAFNFGELRLSNVYGYVFRDLNNDGVQTGVENRLAGAVIRLTGIDDRGVAVNLVTTSNFQGFFSFQNLRPSNAVGYTLTVTPPAGSGLGVGKTGGPRGSYTYGRISQVVVNPGDNLFYYRFALIYSDKFIL